MKIKLLFWLLHISFSLISADLNDIHFGQPLTLEQRLVNKRLSLQSLLKKIAQIPRPGSHPFAAERVVLLKIEKINKALDAIRNPYLVEVVEIVDPQPLHNAFNFLGSDQFPR